MAASEAQYERLRYAARQLITAGVVTPVIRLAAKDGPMQPGLALRVAREFAAHRAALPGLGVDPSLLPDPDLFAEVPKGPAPMVAMAVEDHVSAEKVLDVNGGDPFDFDDTLDGLRGIGVAELAAAKRTRDAEALMNAGIENVFDVVMRVPLRYVDRSQIVPVGALRPGMRQVAAVGRIDSSKVDYRTRIVKFVIGDDSGKVTVMFFNATWRAKQLHRGDTVLLVGDVTVWKPSNSVTGFMQMVSPMVETLTAGGAVPPFIPVYPQSGKHGVSTWLIQRCAVESLRRIESLDDPVPDALVQQRGFPSRLSALRAVHVPSTAAAAKGGRDRLAYDELLRLQLALGVRRAAQQAQQSVRHAPTNVLVEKWRGGLPFDLTGAQDRAVETIRDRLSSAPPMNMLLQGDVGAGKTAVICAAALMAIEGGYQVALMAPTELLASQHYADIAGALEPLGVKVDLLVSRVGARARRDVIGRLGNGDTGLVIGTHSVLSDDVQFQALGLVVIDEQHRFGVAQRAALVGKGPDGATPDVLVATATPIPRTAALTVYGDLDVAVLDELPPGRVPIKTAYVEDVDLGPDGAADETWRLVRGEVDAGRQAYVVCALVEESESLQAKAAEDALTALHSGALSGLRLGMVHGKQKASERAEVMARFSAGEVDVLVATTVIEVGVNVPNATVMVVLDASRFGLAQLHQLRGRVGRGSFAGTCMLTGETKSEVARARMDAMCATTSGFELSEIDLKLRGAGSLAGVAQAGHRVGLVVADLLADRELMMSAREDAGLILAADGKLGRRPTLRHEVEAALGEDAGWLLHG